MLSYIIHGPYTAATPYVQIESPRLSDSKLMLSGPTGDLDARLLSHDCANVLKRPINVTYCVHSVPSCYSFIHLHPPIALCHWCMCEMWELVAMVKHHSVKLSSGIKFVIIHPPITVSTNTSSLMSTCPLITRKRSV